MKKPLTSKLSAMYRNDPHQWRLVILMIVWMVFMALTRFRKFYTLINFQTMCSQFPEFGLMALGVMLTMITGGIDLSVVGTANLTSIPMAFMMIGATDSSGSMSGGTIILAFLLAIVIGAACGALNGFTISKLRIPPILATMGANELFAGICMVMTNGNAISKFSRRYAETINNKLFGLIPVQLLIFAAMAAVVWFMLNKTSYGTKLYLLGTSSKAAWFSGINNTGILMKTYITSGICAALGGMIMLANYNSARADYGSVYTLQCVLIVVLGGVNPNGGKGKVSGVVLAICLLRMLETGINRFPKISSYYISLIWGGVLILVMVLNYFAERRPEREIRKMQKKQAAKA